MISDISHLDDGYTQFTLGLTAPSAARDRGMRLHLHSPDFDMCASAPLSNPEFDGRLHLCTTTYAPLLGRLCFGEGVVPEASRPATPTELARLAHTGGVAVLSLFGADTSTTYCRADWDEVVAQFDAVIAPRAEEDLEAACEAAEKPLVCAQGCLSALARFMDRTHPTRSVVDLCEPRVRAEVTGLRDVAEVAVEQGNLVARENPRTNRLVVEARGDATARVVALVGGAGAELWHLGRRVASVPCSPVNPPTALASLINLKEAPQSVYADAVRSRAVGIVARMTPEAPPPPLPRGDSGWAP